MSKVDITKLSPERLKEMQDLVAKMQIEGKEYKAKVDSKQKQREKLEEAQRQAPQFVAPQAKIVEGKATHLFVDSKRIPSDVSNSPLPTGKTWAVARDYKQFKQYIDEHGIPEYVTFDFNLGDKTGLDCAKYLVSSCLELKKDRLPEWNCHSTLMSGVQLIESYLFRYGKWKKEYTAK